MPDTNDRPASPAPEQREPHDWAARKGTEKWMLAAAKARFRWIENTFVTEAAYDRALEETGNGRLGTARGVRAE